METWKKYSIEWYVHPDQDVFFNSKLLTGLCRLQHRGIVDLRFRNSGSLPQNSPAVSFWEVTRLQDSLRRRLVLDMADSPEKFNDWAIGIADIYFKRSYVSKIIASKY